MPWPIFIIEPTDLFRRSLRRFSRSGKECSSRRGYHNAATVIDPELREDELGEGSIVHTDTEEVEPWKSDPRWPTHCECGHRFHPEDNWQLDIARLYRGAPDGKLYALDQDLPIGAMWDADWLSDNFRGPDGKAWSVRVPGGIDFLIYGKSSDGSPWNVSGTAPKFTLHPSIGYERYHGYIKDGIITDDVEGRTYS